MLQTSQVLSRRLCVSCAAVLPFKDSEGGTWPVELSDFKRSYICRHAPVKKQSRYADRSMGFAHQQQFGPAISETAEPSCATSAQSSRRIPLAGLRRGLASLTKKFLRDLSAVLSDLLDYLFVQPDIHRG